MRAPSTGAVTFELPIPSPPQNDADRHSTRAPVAVVRRYLELVQASRELSHDYHRQVASSLGTGVLVEEVDRWARHWSKTGDKETVLGRAGLEGDRAVVRTTGEGFGPNRYHLIRNDGGDWRIDRIEVCCSECEESGRCVLCEGRGCEACGEGVCQACSGSGWIPYQK